MDIKVIMKQIKDKLSQLNNIISERFSLSEKTVQVILVIVIVLLGNVAGTKLNIRFDMTRNNMYSLSEKSKDVVSNLSEKLKIRVLFSRDLPAQHTAVFRYLKDLLDEYDYYGNNNFSYEIVEEDELEDEARNYGVSPIVSKEFASDQVKIRRPYMGLVVQQADVIEKLDAVVNTTGMEYEITSLMKKVANKVDSLIALKQPIKVSLYLDSTLRFLPLEGIGDMADNVEKAVEKSNLRNYDKLVFNVIDTSKEKNPAAIAQQFGLSSLQWKGGKGNFGKQVPAGDYMLGVVVENGKKFETIDVTVPTILGIRLLKKGQIEERINEAVSSVISNNPAVGYILGHGEVNINDDRSRDGGGLFKELISDMYNLKAIDLTKEEIPSNIQTIIINGPTRKYTDAELFKIDQFLMKGKSAIFFVESFRELKMPGRKMVGQSGVVPIETGLEGLLAHYGVSVNKDIVLDKSCAKVQLQTFISDYPLFPIIKESGFNRLNVITRYLKGLAFAKSSSISINNDRVAKQGLIKRELIRSSSESWLMKGRIQLHPLLMRYDPKSKQPLKSYTLAALLSGRLESYFRDKDVPAGDGAGKGGEGITAVSRLSETIKSGKSEIIVVGSSMLTTSGFLVDSDKILSSGAQRTKNDVFPNGLFLHSMVDYLAGNYYVPEMRNKRLDYNPLERVPDNMKFVYKIFNMAGVPLLIILIGFFTWRRVHLRRKIIFKEFSGEAQNENK